MHVSHLSRRSFIKAAALAAGGLVLGGGLVGCADVRDPGSYVLMEGSQTDRGFVVDDALQTPSGRTLHFSLHVPDSYDGSVPYALYVACLGWEGLYFQGVGANLQEDYPFVANDYIADMIVASPQLDDWGEQSAADVVELTEWLLGAYSIDAGRVYLSGCSGGGETISLVLGTRPELYRRALHTISRWDGDIDELAAAEVPVYMAIGEHDDYYGSEPAREAAERMREAYRACGLSASRIDELARAAHLSSSYLALLIFPLHAGFHAAKTLSRSTSNAAKPAEKLGFAAWLLASCVGIYEFFSLHIWDYASFFESALASCVLSTMPP